MRSQYGNSHLSVVGSWSPWHKFLNHEVNFIRHCEIIDFLIILPAEDFEFIPLQPSNYIPGKSNQQKLHYFSEKFQKKRRSNPLVFTIIAIYKTFQLRVSFISRLSFILVLRRSWKFLIPKIPKCKKFWNPWEKSYINLLIVKIKIYFTCSYWKLYQRQ